METFLNKNIIEKYVGISHTVISSGGVVKLIWQDIQAAMMTKYCTAQTMHAAPGRREFPRYSKVSS